MVERPRIAFVGAGRLAGALAPELARLGYSVAAVASRSRASAIRSATGLHGFPSASELPGDG